MQKNERKLKNIKVERTAQNKILLEWEFIDEAAPTSISLYRAMSTDDTEDTEFIEKVEGSNIVVDAPGRSQRHYYKLVPENGTPAWAAERRIPMEGTVNIRDMGGYKAENGSEIKWGIIFRGDSLQRATESDVELINHLKIGDVFDFRREEEVEKGPNKFPENHSITYHHLPVVHGEFNFVSAMERLKKNKADWIREETIIKGYLDNTVHFATTWGRVINRLSMDDCPPLFFHCTAGKDRTGICAALILSALDVPRETILYDYLLSNPYIKVVWDRVQIMIRQQGIDPDKLAPFFSAPEYAMSALLDHLEEVYGGALGFLIEKAGVDDNTIAQLKQRVMIK